MTDGPIFTETDFKECNNSTLGVHYFSARRIVNDAMSSLGNKDFSEIVKTASDLIYRHIQDAVEASMWADAEANLQGKVWHMVDDIVRGLLSGEKWLMDRYVLGEIYDCEKVRATVAKHIGDELAAKRIADLEDALAKAKQDLEWYRGR
jgi:hypothetical protein